MLATRLYTPAEAAALSGIAVKAVHNAIDKHIVSPAGEGAPEASRTLARRRLDGEGILLLKLWYGVGATLTQDRRQRLFEEIRRTPSAPTVRADDLLIIDVAEARKQIDANIARLKEAESAIHAVDEVMGGEPVFKGTRVLVRHVVAMLAQGATAAEILEGYPALDARRLDLARIWVAAHPAVGRPRKRDDGFRLQGKKRLPLKSRRVAHAPLDRTT